MAFGALSEAVQLGLKVSRDLSIVGFDDIPQAAGSTPTLTSIRQPSRTKVQMAAAIVVGDLPYSTEFQPLSTELIQAFVVSVAVGAGPIGMVTALAALAGGCSRAFVANVQEPKLELAAKYSGVTPVNVRKRPYLRWNGSKVRSYADGSRLALTKEKHATPLRERFSSIDWAKSAIAPSKTSVIEPAA